MRKHLAWVLAIALLATTAGVAFASTANDSTVSMKVTPKTLSKKKFKPATLNIETTTTVNGDPGTALEPTLFPDPTSKVVLSFDNDIKFNPKAKGLKGKCTEMKLNLQTTIKDAKKACKHDQVGSGSATGCAGTTTCLPIGPNGTTGIPTDVLAFNGGKINKKKTSFLLWTNNAVSGTLVLPAVLKKGGSGDFGSTLTVTVPPVGGGAGSLTEFKTKVKYKDYVTARCHDKNHKLDVKAKFTYAINGPGHDGGGPDTVSGSSKCKT